MNKHIELVKKYLADNDSVTLQELEANEDAAADYDAWTDAAAYWAAYWAVEAAAYRGDDADYVESCKKRAIEAIKEYEELTK